VDSLGRLPVGLLKLSVDPPYKPESKADWQQVALGVRKSTVVHQQEDLLKENLLVAMRQAKKTTLPVGTLPPSTHHTTCSLSTPSSRCRARSCPCVDVAPASHEQACA